MICATKLDELERIELRSLISSADKDIKEINRLIEDRRKQEGGIIELQKQNITLKANEVSAQKDYNKQVEYNNNLTSKGAKLSLDRRTKESKALIELTKASNKYNENQELLLTKQRDQVEAEREIKELEEAKESAQKRIIELNGLTVDELENINKLNKQQIEDLESLASIAERSNQFRGVDGAFLQKQAQARLKELAEEQKQSDAKARIDDMASIRKIAIFEKDLQSARNSLLTNAELEKNYYNESIMRLKEYGDLKNLTGEEINNLEAELYAAHLQRMSNIEEKNNNDRSSNFTNTLNDVATGFAIFDNLTQAATVNRQRQLDNDLRNSEQFTSAQIANKEKEASRLFNIQKEADKASIASSTLVGVMAQMAQGNFLQAAYVGSAGALSYARAATNSYQSPVSPSSSGITEAPPSVSNNTTNNNGGNITTININNSSGGEINEESLKEFFQKDGILFDANTAQGELLR